MVSWGISKPPNTLGLTTTATEQCRAANKSEMQLPLPPSSDWQGVLASPVTPCSNLLLLITADPHSQLLAKPLAPRLLLAKKLSLPSKAGAERAVPCCMLPWEGWVTSDSLEQVFLLSFIGETPGAVPSFLAQGWG